VSAIPSIPFEPFPKIPRLRRTLSVSEKIDGTNASVYITEDGKRAYAGSRNRWITTEDDNYGFAKWVQANHDALLDLGPGYHFGEWWGQGIQRGYGLSEKRFSLFNVARWNANNPDVPACCHVVPILAVREGDNIVEEALTRLRREGSVAAPGFMRPEGVVVYHTAARSLFKVLLEGDDVPKGAHAADGAE
jgi:hypothetical protein